MLYSITLLAALLAAAGSLAAPLTLHPRAASTLEQTLLLIAPSSSTCASAPIAEQCRTASQAALFIEKSFSTYNITSTPEKAALISLMAYETASFKYNENMFPGRPGQGTRNMQMIGYNVLYVQSMPCMDEELARAAGVGSAGVVSAEELSGGQANAVRRLVTGDDEMDFGSAAWFLTTQCSAEIRKGLQTEGLEGWARYITECVGTTVADRQVMFTAALAALGG